MAAAVIDGPEKYMFSSGPEIRYFRRFSMKNVEKSPEDQFDIFADFTPDISTDDSAVSYTATSINLNTGASSTSAVVAASGRSGSEVQVMIEGGQAAGEKHKLTVTLTTTLGNKYEKDFFVDVREILVGHFPKQSGDKFSVGIDFAPRMEADETLDNASIVVTAVLGDDGSDVLSTVVSGYGVDTTDTNQKVILGMQAGSDGDFIKIGVQVSCDDTVLGIEKIFHRNMTMGVKDI